MTPLASTSRRVIKMADGRNINVRVIGDGGYALILVHGFGENSYAWGEISHDLTQTYTIYAVDLSGHGDSDWNLRGQYEVDGFTADLISAIQQLELTQFSIVGHSLGAEVALQVTSALQESVTKLILVEFNLEAISEEVRQHSLMQFNAQFRRYSTLSEYYQLLQAQRPLADSDALRCYANNSLRPITSGGFVMKCDPAVRCLHGMTSSAFLASQQTAISKLHCPFLLIRGSGSAILRAAAARAIVSSHPRASLRLVNGAGHAVMLDQPAAFYREVVRFLPPL